MTNPPHLPTPNSRGRCIGLVLLATLSFLIALPAIAEPFAPAGPLTASLPQQAGTYRLLLPWAARLGPGPSATVTPTGTATSTPVGTPTSTPTRTATPTLCANPPCASATPTRTASPTMTQTPDGTWQVILQDGFEGAFPGVWQPDGDPTWGTTTCKSFGGTHSLWPAAAGEYAAVPCVDNYPDNLYNPVIYGPFSLSGAAAAELRFKFWSHTEPGGDQFSGDQFYWAASTDGQLFYGYHFSGDSLGWVDGSMDLANVHQLGNLCGQPQVWIAFFMTSDETINYEGVFIDDVLLRKSATAHAASTQAALPTSLKVEPAVVRLR